MVADKVEYSSLGRAPQDKKFGELYELITHAGGEVPPNMEPSATLTTDLKLDSLGRVELLSEIEDHYRIEINESEFNAATTIGEVEGVIRQGQAEQADEYPYPHWPHRWPISWVRIFLLYLIIVPLNRIMGRPTIKGVENLRSVSGPLLLIANHLTMVDHVLIICALPGRLRRRVSIAMDGELLRGWIKAPEGTGWSTRLRYRIQYLLVAFFFNVFSMPQHSGFRRSFAFAGEMVDRGYNILVFPEGRRSSDGKLQPFKPGIGLLTKGLMLPVVPIRIDGLKEVAKQGKHFAPRGAIMVTIGKPVIYPIRAEAEFIAKDLEQSVICLAKGGPTGSELSLS
jgi:long-chain acyl-CoA synthetase